VSYNITISGAPLPTHLGIDPNQQYRFMQQHVQALVNQLPGVTAASATLGPLGHVTFTIPPPAPPIPPPHHPVDVHVPFHTGPGPDAHPGYTSGL
jgi:hypothetical protein